MNSMLTFEEYKEEIVNYMVGHFKRKLVDITDEIDDSSDFLKICYNDGWSVYYVANMLNI